MAGEQYNLYWESLRAFLKPIVPYLEDETVSEVIINGANATYVERRGLLKKTDVHFEESALMAAVRNLAQYVGKELTADMAHMAARLPDGSRVQVVLPPCSRNGICLAIRKFSRDLLTLENLIQFGSLTEKAARWLEIVTKMRKNTIISGGTSSGKTSLLNILGGLVRPEERIIVMEDSAELQIKHDHVLSMETRAPSDKDGRGEVSMRDLVKISLRLRPDRIIVGEVRGAEALDLLQAMSTGHSGSMGTIHANDPVGALRRLETLATYGTAGDIPLSAIRNQVASAIEVVAQGNRLQDGSRRITHIAEVLPLDLNGMYKTQNIFEFKIKGRDAEGRLAGSLEPTGIKSCFMAEIPYLGIELEPNFFEASA